MAYDVNHLLTVGAAKQIHDNLKSALDYHPLNVLDNKVLSGTTGFLPSNITDNSSYCCLCISCTAGDTFTATATTGANVIPIVFSDSEGNAIQSYYANDSITNYKAIAPANSAYFTFNALKSRDHFVARGVVPAVETQRLQTVLGASLENDNANDKYNLLTRGNVFPLSRYAWSYGGLVTSTGANNAYNTPDRLRSDYCPVAPSTEYKIVGIGYFFVYQYNSSKTFISRTTSSWLSPEYKFTTNANAAYIRFLLKKDSAGTGRFDDESIAKLNMACFPVKNELDDLLETVKLDSKNALDSFAVYQTATSNGVTFTWNGATKKYNVNGTSTASSWYGARDTLFNSTLPDSIVKGGIYLLNIDSESTDIGVLIALKDSNNTALLTYYREETCYVYIPKNAASMEISICIENGTTVTNKKIGIALEYQKPTDMPVNLKCITYNVGCYNFGHVPSEQYPIQPTANIVAELKEFFRTHPCDIFAAQENQINVPDSDLETMTNFDDVLYSYQFPYHFTTNQIDDFYWPSLYLKYPVIWKWTGTMFNDGRRYAKAIINVHGIPVLVFSVHCALSLEAREANYAEIDAAVRDSMGGFDHAIILGDFNAGNGVTDYDAQPEYTAFINDGWHTANGGWWGQFNTVAPESSSSPARRLDSILTTTNIDINTYDTSGSRSTLPSDHLPLYCDLTLYPSKDISR